MVPAIGASNENVRPPMEYAVPLTTAVFQEIHVSNVVPGDFYMMNVREGGVKFVNVTPISVDPDGGIRFPAFTPTLQTF